MNLALSPAPVECPPVNMAGVMSTTQSGVPEYCQTPPEPAFPIDCNDPDNADEGFCVLLEDEEIFSYVEDGEIKVINRINNIVYEIILTLPSEITNPAQPTWARFEEEDNIVYRLAFGCTYHDTPNLICFWDSNNSANDGYYHLSGMTYFERIDISSDGQYVATDSNPLGQIIVYHNGVQSLSPQGRRPNWSNETDIYYLVQQGNAFQTFRFPDYAPPTPPNVQPTSDFYDVREGEVIYWVNNQLYRANESGITPELVGMYNTEDPLMYPLMLAPASRENATKLIAVRNDDSPNECIDLIDYTTGSAQQVICLNNIGTNFDWEAGFDLRFLLPSSPYNCLNPNPQAVPSTVVDQCIAELAEYGIIAFPTGLPTQQLIAGWSWTIDPDPLNTQVYSRSWTVGEIQQVLRGAQTVASTFYALENDISEINVDIHGTHDEAKNIFRAVMGESSHGHRFYVLRVTSSGFTYNTTNLDGCYGAVTGCTENNFSSIAFYANFYDISSPDYEYVQRIVVHEFGHRFDNQTGTEPIEGVTRFKRALYYPLGEDNKNPLYDCGKNGVRNQRSDIDDDDGIIFGVLGNSFARGLRGWGTPVASCTHGVSCEQTYFQINPTDNPIYIREETAADMFLNWVYRRITDGPVDWTSCALDNTQIDDEPQEIGDWQGFRNIDKDGIFDTTLPGNARYEWMENFMTTIFNERYGSIWSFTP